MTRKTVPNRNKKPGRMNAMIRLKLRSSDSNINVLKSVAFHVKTSTAFLKNSSVNLLWPNVSHGPIRLASESNVDEIPARVGSYDR